MSIDRKQTGWSDLSFDVQLRLREEYSRDPVCLVGTCAMDKKIEHFSAWLAERDVIFTIEDLSQR
jgi:hypothetical protein